MVVILLKFGVQCIVGITNLISVALLAIEDVGMTTQVHHESTPVP